MPQINLLPWREAERKRKRQEFAFAAIGALVLAGLVGLIVNWELGAAIDHQNDRNQLLKNEIAELDKQITEILGLEQQKQRLVARMEVIDQLQRSRPGVVHLFDQLVKTLPDGVYLTEVKQTDKRIQLKGIAQSSTRVSAFMRNIDGSQWLADPSLEIVETKGSADSGAAFTLYANQTGLPTEEDTSAKNKRKPGKGGKAGASS